MNFGPKIFKGTVSWRGINGAKISERTGSSPCSVSTLNEPQDWFQFC